jgi:peptide/nickel transport system substrate-binding protein
MKRALLIILVLVSVSAPRALRAQFGGELRFCLRSEPKTFNPLLVDDESSETIRYLTGGVLIRLNRKTQVLEPNLAVSWKLQDGGKVIRFKLRENLSFSDGTPFSAQDVAFTIRQLMAPDLHSSTGDSFRSGNGKVRVETPGSNEVLIAFPVPIAGLERLFDQVAIMSSRSSRQEMSVLGPFFVDEYKPGAYVHLQRNPHYWKRDSSGRQLPYLNSIRLDIQQNRDLELLRFRRGEIDLINRLDAEYFDRLKTEVPEAVHDAGPSLDTEQLWFNQSPTALIPAYEKIWFQDMNFRRAISAAINRNDLARIVFNLHARPAIGAISPADHFWLNQSLESQAFNPSEALKFLQQSGFRMDDKVLQDRNGNVVEFSLMTNSGNKSRERMAALIQQDLSDIGIRLNIITLDFPALIERLTRTSAYEACLLGLVNLDLDPNSQMNIWLSSGSNHQWNPNQKAPATSWEAEIDHLMTAQARATADGQRKIYFDRVQQIVAEQLPFIYLVTKDSLSAISPALKNSEPVGIRPETYWNIDELYFAHLPGGRE